MRIIIPSNFLHKWVSIFVIPLNKCIQEVFILHLRFGRTVKLNTDRKKKLATHLCRHTSLVYMYTLHFVGTISSVQNYIPHKDMFFTHSWPPVGTHIVYFWPREIIYPGIVSVKKVMHIDWCHINNTIHYKIDSL